MQVQSTGVKASKAHLLDEQRSGRICLLSKQGAEHRHQAFKAVPERPLRSPNWVLNAAPKLQKAIHISMTSQQWLRTGLFGGRSLLLHQVLELC